MCGGLSGRKFSENICACGQRHMMHCFQPSAMIQFSPIVQKTNRLILENNLLSPCQEWISDSTKEQRGRCRTRNNRQGDRQYKALVKGCRERTRARGSVSSQEKGHTK